LPFHISVLYFHGSYFHSISNRLHQFEHHHRSNEWNQSRKFVGVMFFSKVSFAPLSLLPQTITFHLPLKLGYKFQLSSVVDDLIIVCCFNCIENKLFDANYVRYISYDLISCVLTNFIVNFFFKINFPVIFLACFFFNVYKVKLHLQWMITCINSLTINCHHVPLER
jgi:hypothetical protein